jgi:mannose-6-phosphate isomerase-like protein (cupin superfamily)
MKTFTMADHFRAESKEYIVGPSALGSRSAYLVFGEVQPGQVGKLSAGHGHEEILLVISGRARIAIGGEETVCGEGQGVYLGVEPSGELRPEGGQPVRYVCSGGHIPGTHHH